MHSLSGKWISGDGFGLQLHCHPSGRIEGTYKTSGWGKEISLDFHGVSLSRKNRCMFAAVVECDPCQSVGWRGEITLCGTLDKSNSRMRMKWMATSSSTGSFQGRHSPIRGKSLLLKFPDDFSWTPEASSEHYAPHTLLVLEGSVQGMEERPAKHISLEVTKKKKP